MTYRLQKPVSHKTITEKKDVSVTNLWKNYVTIYLSMTSTYMNKVFNNVNKVEVLECEHVYITFHLKAEALNGNEMRECF